MTLDQLVGPDAILIGITPPTRKAAFQAVAQQMAPALGVGADAIFQALTDRERLGTTGFGGGIAIPHGRLAGIAGMHGGLAILGQPIDYGAVDHRPVDLLFVLLAPEDAGALHLKTLARVSRALRDPGIAARLRGANDPGAVRAILAADGERAAA